MTIQRQGVEEKALQINLDKSKYGVFAEIGAGQEIARHFFQAGRASNTIAKTISAYDMTFSDEIYGKDERYVCQSRVAKMLDHEFQLLVDRLTDRQDSSQFFAIADTVATSSDPMRRSHAWMAVRFQARPGGPTNDILLHMRLLDRSRLQQQAALGLIGVNLLHAAFYRLEGNLSELIASLMDGIDKKRIEIDYINFVGDDLKHFDHRLACLELVQQGMTQAVMFGAEGQVIQASDTLFGHPVLVQRGTFRPVTKANVEILQAGLKQLLDEPVVRGKNPLALMELTMHSLANEGEIDQQDFLDRIDTLCAVGHHVLISNFNLFYQLKAYLRRCTDQMLAMVIGASHLERIFEEKHYEDLPGGILEGFGRLIDDHMKFYVYPYKEKNLCMTAASFHPKNQKLEALYRYLRQIEAIVDISGCDEIDVTLHSGDVRKLLQEGDPRWEELVPEKVVQLIREKALFKH